MGERTVNARQLEVLEWIVAGCPEGVMTGTSHKTTAVTLQNRRLAVVSKRKGVWRADPTDAGRYFVKHGAYPAGHWSASAELASRPATPASPRGPKRERKVTGLRPVDQMLADLAEADGELKVSVDPASRYWENLASSAIRFKKVPEGKLLKVVRGKDWSERIIRLEDPPVWMTVELDPVPVAEQLRSPHPAIKALRDHKDRLSMKREVRARALRILDAIAKAAVDRGYTVTEPQAQAGYRHPKGHLVVTIGHRPNTLIVDELNDSVPHEPTKYELREKERYPNTARIRTHDQVPSGRLRIKLERGWHVRQVSFSDTKTISLEDRLPHVLQEVELRAAAEEERERARQREQEERQWQWQQVRDDAIVQAREQHRGKVLSAQVDGWHRALQLDAYLDAMAERAQSLMGDEKAAAQEWLAWARDHRDRIDPWLSRCVRRQIPSSTPTSWPRSCGDCHPTARRATRRLFPTQRVCALIDACCQ